MHGIALSLARGVTFAAAVAAFALGCSGGDPEEAAEATSEGALTRAGLRDAFRRVVIGRIYQHEDWLVPAADTYRPNLYPTLRERRIAYVCDTYAPLDPTYVSGLVRLDVDDQLGTEQIAVYKGIQRCLRKRANHPIRYDVVLNALHYADPEAYPTGGKGADALRDRLRDVAQALAPDLWFFDFYTVPFHDSKGVDWHAGAIVAGIDWIHAHGGLVGGNVWGNSVPDGTDFAAVDDSAGLDRTREQAAALRGVPLLMHIQNDPQADSSAGLAFIGGTPQDREGVVTREARLQAEARVSYMFPVFFPQKFVNGGSDGGKGKHLVAYDARQDGDMYALIKKLMR